MGKEFRKPKKIFIAHGKGEKYVRKEQPLTNNYWKR